MQLVALCIMVGLLALLLGLMAYLGSHMQGPPGKRVNSAPTVMGGGHEWLRKAREAGQKRTRQERTFRRLSLMDYSHEGVQTGSRATRTKKR